MKTLFAILLLALLTSACNLLRSPEAAAPIPIENVATTQPTAPTPVSSFPEAGYQLYVADAYGIVFQYPEDWFLLDASDEIKALNNGYTVTIASFDIANAPGRGGIPAESSKVDISIGTMNTMFGEDLSLDKIEEYTASVDSTVELLASERLTLPDGTPVLMTRVKGHFGDIATSYAVVIDGTAINIGGLGDLTLVEKIAMSVRRYP